jgi:hypothetical protein
MKDNYDDITEMMEWSEEQYQNINSVQAGVWTTVFTIANWDIYELKGAYLDIRNLPANQTIPSFPLYHQNCLSLIRDCLLFHPITPQFSKVRETHFCNFVLPLVSRLFYFF